MSVALGALLIQLAELADAVIGWCGSRCVRGNRPLRSLDWHRQAPERRNRFGHRCGSRERKELGLEICQPRRPLGKVHKPTFELRRFDGHARDLVALRLDADSSPARSALAPESARCRFRRPRSGSWSGDTGRPAAAHVFSGLGNRSDLCRRASGRTAPLASARSCRRSNRSSGPPFEAVSQL